MGSRLSHSIRQARALQRDTRPRPNGCSVGRPSKSAAGSAEKPAIIFGRTRISNMTHLQLPSAVIDTNVVLDWLVFGSADTAELASFVTSRRLQWLSTAAM